MPLCILPGLLPIFNCKKMSRRTASVYGDCSGEGQGKEVLDEEGCQENHLGSLVVQLQESNCSNCCPAVCKEGIESLQWRLRKCNSCISISIQLTLSGRAQCRILESPDCRARRCKATMAEHLKSKLRTTISTFIVTLQ